MTSPSPNPLHPSPPLPSHRLSVVITEEEIQRRLEELIQGERPLVERQGRSDLEVVIEEILQDKISLVEPETAEAD